MLLTSLMGFLVILLRLNLHLNSELSRSWIFSKNEKVGFNNQKSEQKQHLNYVIMMCDHHNHPIRKGCYIVYKHMYSRYF